jgi:tRNA dimethylallyltransferase
MKYNLIVILGPTASGKTELAVKLARDMGSEIISADSRQVYRGMNIGTGKDLSEYVVNDTSVPYHLIDVVDFDHEFNVFEYQRRFFESFLEISRRGILPIMVGGTGLYIESVLRGYRMLEVPENVSLRKELETENMETLVRCLLQLSPSVHNTTDLKDRKRLIRAIEIAEYSRNHESEEMSIPLIEPLVIGVRWEREILRRRITERLRKRFEEGMIEEVEGLLSSGISWEKLDFFGLEYRYIGLYLKRRLSYDEMFQKLNTRIHQFAKKQGTWFRRMEKQGIEIHWIDNADFNALKELTVSQKVFCE